MFAFQVADSLSNSEAEHDDQQSSYTEPEQPFTDPPSSSSSSTSGSDSDSTSSSEPENDEDGPCNILVHDTIWHFDTVVNVDRYKDGVYGPKVNITDDPLTYSELDFWKLFFPTERLDNILQYTNEKLRDKRRVITKGEKYKKTVLYAVQCVQNVIQKVRPIIAVFF